MNPEVLEIQLPTHTASCLAWGPADGPLALLLHGFPDSAWSWRFLGPHLAGLGWRVVAPHTRGYAPSGIPSDGSYAVAALMADAVLLHEALGGDERAVLVGHDWGAITANGLGAHPDSPFARIVALAVPPLAAMSGGSPLTLLRQARMSWYTLFNQLPVLPERLAAPLVRKLWRDWSPGYDASEDLPHVLDSLATRAHRSAAFGYYRAVARPWGLPAAYRTWAETWTAMPTAPLLVLHGADDGCMQVALAEGARDRLPSSAELVVVPDAGHFLQVEQPDVVNGLVAEFVGRSSGESRTPTY